MAKSKQPATERVVSYVKPSEGYWVIPSEEGDLHLAQAVNPAMTQDKLAGYRTTEGFHGASVPEHFRLFKAVYDLRDKSPEADKARQFIKQTMRQTFPNTLTRFSYAPEDKDTIIHGYKTPNQTESMVDLVGPEGRVTEVLDLETSMALTGKIPEEVQELMQYLNDTLAFIWRFNSKPKQRTEAVAWFGAYSVWAVLNCYWNPSNRVGSLGVRVASTV